MKRIDISIVDEFFLQMESIIHDLTVIDRTVNDNSETATVGIDQVEIKICIIIILKITTLSIVMIIKVKIV